MWVFDGETWIEEGKGSEKTPKPGSRNELLDEFQPELELDLPVTPRIRNWVPPIPTAVPVPVPIPRRRK